MVDTIIALATPTGRSGIGVIRLSGPDAVAYARRLCGDDATALVPRRAFLRTIVDLRTGEPIDQAVITWFKAPHSFTGEDVVEVSCHGSPVLLRQVIDACLELGGRLADPGEFTMRALANGRIDLTEAEAIRDLIDAQTAASARQAVRQLNGELSRQIQPLKDELLSVIVVLESALEFVEDDLPVAQLDSVGTSLADIATEATRLAGTFKAGHLVRDGLRAAIVGRPNVGKSSLFNILLGSERAIVTDIAGTTRDHLHERIIIENIPVSLIDTAGLRATKDTVESIGVERSKAVMADADIVIVMLDSSEQTSDEDREILDSVKDLAYIIALNKIDKVPSTDIDHFVAAEHSRLAHLREKIVPVSAKSGEGIEDLKHAIVAAFGTGDIATGGFLITDARHHDLLIRTTTEIENSIELLDRKMSEEIVLVGLHNALRYLGSVTGETTTEDMLTHIFSTFCIGK